VWARTWIALTATFEYMMLGNQQYVFPNFLVMKNVVPYVVWFREQQRFGS
jgi:hypothetical protein